MLLNNWKLIVSSLTWLWSLMWLLIKSHGYESWLSHMLTVKIDMFEWLCIFLVEYHWQEQLNRVSYSKCQPSSSARLFGDTKTNKRNGRSSYQRQGAMIKSERFKRLSLFLCSALFSLYDVFIWDKGGHGYKLVGKQDD